MNYQFQGKAFAAVVKLFSQRMTTRKLAERAGTSASTISRWQNGTLPDIGGLVRFCDVVGIPPGNFFKSPDVEELISHAIYQAELFDQEEREIAS